MTEGITEPAEVSRLLATLRTEPGFVTNLFLSEAEWRSLATEGRLQARVVPAGVVMSHYDGPVERIYFAAASYSALADAMCALPGRRTMEVADVVGTQEAVTGAVGVILSVGFELHATFQRMTRVGGGTPGPSTGGLPEPDAGCSLASDADAGDVHGLMCAYLDPVSERVPDAADVVRFVADGNVLVAREGGVLAAFLVFAIRGTTTTLRYWFVRPAFRGRAYGRTLLLRYLASQSRCRRFLLWVDARNSRAMEAYVRAGYRADGLVDVILRRSH